MITKIYVNIRAGILYPTWLMPPSYMMLWYYYHIYDKVISWLFDFFFLPFSLNKTWNPWQPFVLRGNWRWMVTLTNEIIWDWSEFIGSNTALHVVPPSPKNSSVGPSLCFWLASHSTQYFLHHKSMKRSRQSDLKSCHCSGPTGTS